MITEDLPGSPAYLRATKNVGRSGAVERGGGSVSPPLCGTIDSAVGALDEGQGADICGARSGHAVLRDVSDALRKDNWLHAHASLEHKQAKSIKKKIRDAFYVDTAEWKRKVCKSADTVVASALTALG